MLKSLTTFRKKWRASRDTGQQIDALLAHADPQAPLAQRNQWLIEIAHWLHRGGALQTADGAPSRGAAGDNTAEPVLKFPPHTRLRYLLQLLERNPAWRTRCAATLRLTLAESDTISLLCESGMPVHSGFIGALLERVQRNLIPPAPSSADLVALFALMFTSPDDAQWVAALPAPLLAQLGALYEDGAAADLTGQPSRLARDLLTAIHTLVCQISATGLSSAIRTRLAPHRTDESPFFRLGRAMDEVERAHADWRDAIAARIDRAPAEHAQADRDTDADTAPDPMLLHQRLLQRVNFLRAMLDECEAASRAVYSHLDENGVSVEIVFQIERMQARLTRIEHLLEAWLSDDMLGARVRLAAELIACSQASRSVSALLRSSFGMLARKVVERSAETGEHYIARDRAEYLSMLKMAAGGGLVTAATVYIKFGVTGAHLQPMVEGFFAGLNYALSFLLMHFLHFTLATKQPAMTAPTIAHKLDGVGTPHGMDAFVTSVIALVRTQSAAIFGNLVLVFPACWLLQVAFAGAFHGNLISPAKAHDTLHSFSLLGPTPLFAALTGVLLWSSSLLSGWADNWFALHRIGDVLTYHRRLRLVFGDRGAARIAAFWHKNLSGIVGNAALGMMLGLVPAILTAFAMPFEVRHVTLSTGAIAAALGVLGPRVVESADFWWAVAGVASMGLLNVLVSFALAFQMAVRSRQLPRTDRRALNRAIWRRILANPLCLLFPLERGAQAADA